MTRRFWAFLFYPYFTLILMDNVIPRLRGHLLLVN